MVARDMALRAGDDEAVTKISRAIDAACADGKIMIMD